MRKIMASAIAAGILAVTGVATAQPQPLDEFEVAVHVDSKHVENRGAAREVIFATMLQIPDVSSIRLRFDEATLGQAPHAGAPTVLRITSLEDGAVQNLKAYQVEQWRHTSAYFNGNALLVELIADPGAQESRIIINTAMVGPFIPPGERSICGDTDDRELSEDPRGGRLMPIGCSAWLIDDENNCFLTAGHCTGSGSQIMEFNVPLSDGSGGVRHPGPEDQYPIDPASMQSNGGQGVGNDWAYFGCFPNTETGLTAYEAQGDSYILAAEAPPVSGQTIRITGYGTTSFPVPPEWNQVQKTHTGPYTSSTGTTVQYATDTTGGNSGSPVINEDTGEAIGIHTHGGCGPGGGANSGTGIHHPALQDALANPLGVCAPLPPLAFDYSTGLPDTLDPSGDTIRVVVSGQGKGVPQTGTGMLHYDTGSGLVSVKMDEVSENVYDAVFPAIDCGTEVTYYFSAETTKGETVNDPADAPEERYASVSATGVEVVFTDDFETDTGWTVENIALEDGPWERGVPAGGGVRGDPASDYDDSGSCYLTDNVPGNSDVDGGPTMLISPLFDATTLADPWIAYARWFTNDDRDIDRMDIHVSNDDGASWVLVESVPHQIGWKEASFRIDDHVTPTSTVRVRFSATDNPNDSVTEAGIDGVRLFGYLCDGGVPGDVDGDGDVDTEDLLAVLAAWGDCDGCPEDFNGDGVVDTEDMLVVLANWT
jgi:hypothetical protein